MAPHQLRTVAGNRCRARFATGKNGANFLLPQPWVRTGSLPADTTASCDGGNSRLPDITQTTAEIRHRGSAT